MRFKSEFQTDLHSHQHGSLTCKQLFKHGNVLWCIITVWEAQGPGTFSRTVTSGTLLCHAGAHTPHTHFKPGIQYPHCATSVCLLPWKGQQGHWVFWVRFLYVSSLDGPISMMLHIQCWELQWGKWWIDRNRRFCSPLWQYSDWIRYPGGIWRRPGGSPGQPCRVVWSHSVAGTRAYLEMSTLIHDSNTR